MVSTALLIITETLKDWGRCLHEHKKTVLYIIFLLIVFIAGYTYGYGRGRGDVQNNGNGVKPVTEQLTETGTAITDAKDGIHEAAGTAGKIEAGLTDATGTVEYIGKTADTSAELIRDCQRIIENVRNRGKTDTETH